MPKRFFYSRSHVYGWTVYDCETQQPAYEACCDLLPPVKVDESGTVCVSPVQLDSEYAALALCRKLNVAWRKNNEQ